MRPAIAPQLILLSLTACLGCSSGTTANASRPRAQLSLDLSRRYQTIEGFGTTTSPALEEARSDWYAALYYGDLRASILRVDLTPTFGGQASEHLYNSPWFHGAPALPGPDGNNVRTYRDVSDYTRPFAGRSASIVVLGPDIEANILRLDFTDAAVQARGLLAQRGERLRTELGDFKLVGSVWSPAPWLKRASGRAIGPGAGVGPRALTPWPFIWAGNFAGGKLDTSGEPRPAFDDSKVGGKGPTSALTQFARGTAAYLLGFQRAFGVRFYALSIQNELSFETYYNSCSYQTTAEYAAALKAVRAELDRHEELRAIRIMGPEDLTGDVHALWTLGGGASAYTKNLRFLNELEADPAARKALSFAAIHGYAEDGVASAGADPSLWRKWAHGWSEPPARGLPAQVRGFRELGYASWMTETSGELPSWLDPARPFPSDAAFGLALKIHQALTAGEQSAWLYWQLSDGKPESGMTLTDVAHKERAAKYVAAKHFFRFIRPGAERVQIDVKGEASLLASAYHHRSADTLTIVLLNPSAEATSIELRLPEGFHGARVEQARSNATERFQTSELRAQHGQLSLSLPAWGIASLVAHGK